MSVEIRHENWLTLRWFAWAVVIPGRALHELTHALVARRWAASVASSAPRSWIRAASSFEASALTLSPPAFRRIIASTGANGNSTFIL